MNRGKRMKPLTPLILIITLTFTLALVPPGRPPVADLQVIVPPARQIFGVWPVEGVGRILYFEIGFSNAGAASWMPTMADLGPDWLGWSTAVQDFYYVVLTDAAGNVVTEESKACVAAVGVITPGRAVSDDPLLGGQWLVLPEEVTNGFYTLQVVVDPFNLWRQFKITDIPCAITNNSAIGRQ